MPTLNLLKFDCLAAREPVAGMSYYLYRLRHGNDAATGQPTYDPGGVAYQWFPAWLQGCEDGTVDVTAEAAAVERAAAAVTPLDPVPPDQWPAWANAVAKLKVDGDAGVGSTIQRLLGTAGVMIKALLAGFGIPCGCDQRRAAWDTIYPY